MRKQKDREQLLHRTMTSESAMFKWVNSYVEEALTMGPASAYQDPNRFIHRGTIFDLLSPEVITLILRQVLLGKKGTRDFESLLLAYPHLQNMVLFVTDCADGDRKWVLKCSPFHKLFHRHSWYNPGPRYPTDLHTYNTLKTVSSVCSPARALSVFIFQEFHQSVKYRWLSSQGSCYYGRNIPPGSIIVSCAPDKRLFGHRALESLAKAKKSILIHQPADRDHESRFVYPFKKRPTTIVDGSSWNFRLANSRWAEKTPVIGRLIKFHSRQLYEPFNTGYGSGARYMNIEIDNCQHLRPGALETSYATRYRIKVAPGCRASHDVKGRCMAPLIVIRGPVILEELTVDYESTRLPEIFLVNTPYAPRASDMNELHKPSTRVLRFTNKAPAGSCSRDTHRDPKCHSNCHQHSWSRSYGDCYRKISGLFNVFEYDSVPDCVLRFTDFMADVTVINISNLQLADPAYYDTDSGKPTPHHIDNSKIKRLTISALVTGETMHRLPRFYLHHTVPTMILEELEGSDRFWDFDWLFGGEKVKVSAMMIKHKCGVESEFLTINDASQLQCFDKDALRTFMLAGYTAEFLWTNTFPVDQQNILAGVGCLQMDITYMPVNNPACFGSELRLRDYTPNLRNLKLTGRLSRAGNWARNISLNIHTAQSLCWLEVRPAIPFSSIWLNSRPLPIETKCRQLPFLTNQWVFRKNSFTNEHLPPKHEVKCEQQLIPNDWDDDPEVFY